VIIAPRHVLVAVAVITPDSLLANATEYGRSVSLKTMMLSLTLVVILKDKISV